MRAFVTKLMRTFATILALLCACAASPAAASPLFELIGDAGEHAGWSGRAAAGSAASTYFNPALLPDAPPGVVLGVFVLNDQIGITLDGRQGGDVPLSYRGATHAGGAVFEQLSVPTRWLREGCKPPECPLALPARPRQQNASSHDTHVYQSIGLVVAPVPKRVALGFYGLLPFSKFTTAHSFFPDEREQFFTNSLHPELYSDRLTATSIALALGVRIARWVSLGAGATLNLRNQASAETFVGNPDDLDRTLVLTTDVGVEVAFAPHFGLAFAPTDRLGISATAHTVQRFDIRTGFATFLPDGNKQLAWRTAVHDYMPVRLALGARWDVISDESDVAIDRHELALSVTATYGFWSKYVDRQGSAPPSNYALHDTLNFVAGARHSYGPWRSFIDGTYVPSAIPLQSGRTNYVDNDRIGAAAGVDYMFKLWSVPFRVGARAQVHALLLRHQIKVAGTDPQRVRDEFPDDAVDTRGDPIAAAAGLQTNNPGWPGFGSSGLLIGGGLSLALLL